MGKRSNVRKKGIFIDTIRSVIWTELRALLQLSRLIWLVPLSASVTDLILRSGLTCNTHWRTKVISGNASHFLELNLRQGIIMQQRNEVSVEYTCQEVQNISVLITNDSFYEESLMNWFCHWLLNKSHVLGNMLCGTEGQTKLTHWWWRDESVCGQSLIVPNSK